MRRDSSLAARLLADLSARGVDVRPRRLEGWAADQLGPLSQTPYPKQVDHYAALAGLASSGRSADVVAVRMAARGHACPRLCDAVRRQAGLVPGDEVEVPALDLTTGASGDKDFASLEQAATDMEHDVGPAPAPMASFLTALRANAGRYAEKLDEPADQVLHSALINILGAVFGAGMYNARGAAAAFGLDPDEVDEEAVDELNAILDHYSVQRAVALFNEIEPAAIAGIAPILRDILAQVLFGSDTSRFPDEHLDWIAVIFSPAVAYAVQIIYAHDHPNSATPPVPPTAALSPVAAGTITSE